MGGSGEHWGRRQFIHATAAGVAGAVTSEARSSAAPLGGPSHDGVATAGGLPGLTLGDAADLVRSKQVSPVDLARACLDRIERLNPRLNAFITVTAETAVAEARAAESEVLAGRWRGPLHGVPIALKDLVDTAGVRTTAGSALFADRVPTEDAFVVTRLKAAGAVFLGKLNMHELAYGGSTVISAFGPVRNPWGLEHTAGGSSAGSAAAVAARLCYGAVGSDTGGSIRQPAAYCGIVGLKPTFGRVSVRGAVPLAWSLDHLGPMTRSVRDAALMLKAMDGYDPKDPVSVDTAWADCEAALRRTPVRGLRIGLPRPYFYEDVDPQVEAATRAALSVLTGLGAVLSDVEVETANDVSIPVLQAEAYAYHETMVADRPDRYDPQTLRRIHSGANIPAAAYIRARRRMEEVRRAAGDAFAKVDVLVTPTTRVPPFTIAELKDPENLRPRELRMLQNTRPWNALGLPVVSIPCGFTEGGLPLGLQIAGPPGGEGRILGVAHAFEQATEWGRRSPPDPA
jgi:aspartyl-tRNA(Asn)/glutamyl-tRNA(Gln) amidotransferase subunit A